MLVDNQLLVILCAQFYKLKSINKKPSSLAADRFCTMAQELIPKASLEVISLGGGLIVSGILASLGINDKIIIFGISNCIPSPPQLCYVVKKSSEATFMRIAGFVCNYPFSMSCDKVEHSGIGRMGKYIAFWEGERVLSICIDADSSKGDQKN